MQKSIAFFQKYPLEILAVLLFSLYFILAAAKPIGVFWSLDEGGKWIYMENVLRCGSPRAPLIYPGRNLDSNLESIALFFYHRVGGNIYTWWPVGFPLLSLPFYTFFGWIGLYLLPALGGAITAYLSGKIVDRLLEKPGYLAVITLAVVGLATPLTFYSTTFWEHSLASAGVMAVYLLLLMDENQPDPKRLVLAGIIGSVAVFFRFEVVLIFIGTGVIVLILSWRRLIPLLVGFSITTLVWMSANYWLSGYLVGSNVSSTQTVPTFLAFKSSGLALIPQVLFNAPLIGAFDLGRQILIFATLGVILTFVLGILPKTRLFSIIFSIPVILVCLYVLAQPSLYRSVHGFIVVCPVVILAGWVFGTKTWSENQKFIWMIVAGLTAFAAGYLLRAWNAAGGLQWGPRYMLALYPMMIIPAFVGLQHYLQNDSTSIKKMVYLIGSLAIAVGLGFSVRGYYTMVLTMDLYQKSSVTLERMKDEIIRTECTWMPMVIPDLYWNGNIFISNDNKVLERNIKEKGLSSQWFVKMYACDTDPIDDELEVYRQIPDGLKLEEMRLEK